MYAAHVRTSCEEYFTQKSGRYAMLKALRICSPVVMSGRGFLMVNAQEMSAAGLNCSIHCPEWGDLRNSDGVVPVTALNVATK